MITPDGRPTLNSPDQQSNEMVPEARPFGGSCPIASACHPGQSDITEPILVPKLRIHLADFPYLHLATPRGCSPWRPDAAFGMHWRARVLHRSPRFSRSARVFVGSVGRQPEQITLPFERWLASRGLVALRRATESRSQGTWMCLPRCSEKAGE